MSPSAGYLAYADAIERDIQIGDERRTKQEISMTTKVTVEANHGWPVRVIAIDPRTNEPIGAGTGSVVPADGAMTFYVHSRQDLRVHEIQPDEIEPAT